VPPPLDPRPFALFLRRRDPGAGVAYIRGIIVNRELGDKADPEKIDQLLVEELASDVIARGLRAANCPPDADGIRRWLPELVKNAAIDRSRRDQKDRGWIDRGADAYAWADRRAPGTDWLARAWLLDRCLDRWLAGDPAHEQTFEMMCRKHLHGWSLDDLAELYPLTPNAISLRIRKLRDQLAPKVAVMDRENGLVDLFGRRVRGGRWRRSQAPRRAWRGVERGGGEARPPVETRADPVRPGAPERSTPAARREAARAAFGTREFSRKEYLALLEGVSTARTATRDLQEGVEGGELARSGTKALARYRFR